MDAASGSSASYGLSPVRRSPIRSSSDPPPAVAPPLVRTSSSASADAAADGDTFYQALSIHLDAPVGSMSISPANRDVALGARRGLYIVDLQNPYDPPRFLPHNSPSPWEVADVQWSCHSARSEWVVSTSNQKALVYNLAQAYAASAPHSPIEHTLHAHSRAITDINWHPMFPDSLATCGLDGCVWAWDLRAGYYGGGNTGRKPVWGVCEWGSGATQVKWNRNEPHQIASSHDNRVLIWDDRMGTVPVKTINAHSAKIYGIDWSRRSANEIVTCSLDRSLKDWSLDDPSGPAFTLRTASPIWRARHLPFGTGVLTLPQRSDPKLSIWKWDRDNPPAQGEKLAPVAAFEGPRAGVKEFVWRTRGGENPGVEDRQFQLVTWSNDHKLRLWPVSEDVLRETGYRKGGPIDVLVPRRGARDQTYRTFQTIDALASPAPLSSPGINSGTDMPSAISERRPSLPRAPTTPGGSLSGGGGPSLLTSSLMISSLLTKPDAPRAPPVARGASMTTRMARNRAQRAQERLAWMEGVTVIRENADQATEIPLRASDAEEATDASDAEASGSVSQHAEDLSRSTTVLGDPVASASATERSKSKVRSGSELSTRRASTADAYANLGEEITATVRNWPNVNFEKIHVAARTCVISLYAPFFIRATFHFPKGGAYPNKLPPTVEIERSPDIPFKTRAAMIQQLRKLMARHAERGEPSFDAAIRYLAGERAQGAATGAAGDVDDEDEDDLSSTPAIDPSPAPVSEGTEVWQNNMLLNVPSPRRCGAIFSPQGQLLLFFPNVTSSNGLASVMSPPFAATSTPKKRPPLSEMFGVLSYDASRGGDANYVETDEALQISSTAYPDVGEEVEEGGTDEHTTSNSLIVIKDARHLTTSDVCDSRYIIDGVPAAVCLENARIAKLALDHVAFNVWLTLHHLTASEKAANLNSTMAQSILSQIFAFLKHARQIQLLGLLACVLGDIFKAYTPPRHVEEETYDSQSITDGARTPVPIRRTASYTKGSWANLAGFFRGLDQSPPRSHHDAEVPSTSFGSRGSRGSSFHLRTPSNVGFAQAETQTRPPRRRIVIRSLSTPPTPPWWAHPVVQLDLELFRLNYAELLYRSGQLLTRAAVLKHCGSAAQRAPDPGVELGSTCQACGAALINLICHRCTQPARPSLCALCHLPVRGVAQACTLCYHVGHSTCISDWFATSDTCPSGCGCKCRADGGASGLFSTIVHSAPHAQPRRAAAAPPVTRGASTFVGSKVAYYA